MEFVLRRSFLYNKLIGKQLQENKDLLSNAIKELKEARDDVQRRVVDEEEADPNEPKKRTAQVRGWLERVHTIEGEVEVIMQKADAQLMSRARCLGSYYNNCYSNYKVGKSIAKKILPLVKDLKVKGDFKELTFVAARPTNYYLSKLQDNKILLRSAMEGLKNLRNDVQRKFDGEEADYCEPKMRTDQVHGWLQSVEIIEGEVEVIMQTSVGLLSNAECHVKDKLVVMKMASVGELKRNGHFQELTFVARPTNYYLSKLQDNKILLRSAMEGLKSLRNDVQRKVDEGEADPNEPKMRTYQVRRWLQNVENIEGEVEVIMQTSYGLLSNAECRVKDKLVVMKIPLVKDLEVKGDFQEVTYRLPPSFVQDIDLVSTVGMESMFDKVWRLINNSTYDNEVVRIMGLHGHGGVGKTTLLEKINNEFNKISENDHFVIFVVVSKPINVQAIQTQIGDRLRLSLQGHERSRADIFNTLRNKKFVILLDDIWERVDLERIGIPNPLGTHCNSSSKVIFTTRSESVCGLMEATHTFQVERLPWDKAWSLFQEKVGKKALNSFSRPRELAKDVAKECGGLPLALVTIGLAMSTKKSVEEWRHALKTLRSYTSKFEGTGDKGFSSFETELRSFIR